MGGFRGFLRKETAEFVRTWRIWVLGGFLLFFALGSPILAKLTPQILASVGSSQPGVVITIPDPIWRDAYAQWIKNLTQMGTMIVIVVAAGSVASEVAAGTAQLVLAKPVSRAGFVLAKFVSIALFVTVLAAAGTAIVQAETYAVFGSAPAAVLWQSSGLWLVGALLLAAVAILASSMMPTLAAVGVSILVFLMLPVAGIWPDVAKYTPAGLLGMPARLVTGTHVDALWPMVTTLAAIAVLLGLACVAFSRREL